MAMNAQAAFARALLDPQATCPGDLRAWNGSDVSRRFAVHRNNVVASLANALAETFPVVQALVGPEFFHAMAAVFVRAHPPRSPVLHAFGCDFPDFIRDFAPARSVPYLADVARLEQARTEALHAADAAPLDVRSFAQMLDRLAHPDELRIQLHPSVRLVQSPFPVYALWAAHQGVGELASLDLAQPEAALVLRPALEVLVLPLEAGTATFVASVLAGEDLAAAAAAASIRPAFDLGGTLATLLHHRAVVSIQPPREDSP